MIARSLHVLMRNLIITNTKHIMNKNISIFLLQLVEMIPPKSEPLNSFMLFILFLCGFGPSNEKFFIVSVDKNSGNTSNSPAEGRESSKFSLLILKGMWLACYRFFSQVYLD